MSLQKNRLAEQLFAVCVELTKHGILPKYYDFRTNDHSNTIRRIVSKVYQAIAEQRHYEAQMLCQLLNATAHDLNDLKNSDPAIYRTLANKLRKSLGRSSFHGIRWEIVIAARLVRQGQKIIGLDRPDLQLLGGYNIECGSARIESSSAVTREDLLRKIRSVVATKDQKSYANSNTALFVDSTNLAFRQTQSSLSIERTDFAEAVRHDSSRYGSVLLHYVVDDPDRNSIRQLYVRFDRENVGSNLKGYLDRFYSANTPQSLDRFTAFREQS